MQDTVTVAVSDSFHELGHELFDHGISQAHVFPHCSTVWKGLSASTFAHGEGLHVLLEVEIQKFKDEIELVAIGMHNVKKADDVGVVHFLEQRNLTDGCARDTFIFGFQTNLLQGNNTAGVGEFAGFVDDTVSSC